MSISYRKLDINLSADKETVLVFGQRCPPSISLRL